MTVLLSEFATLETGSIVDGLEDLSVEVESFWSIEVDSHDCKSVSQSLDTDSNWSVSHIRVLGFLDWVVVDVDNLVQISDDLSCDLDQIVKVEGLVIFNEFRQSD